MPICNLSDVLSFLKPGQCLLGLDPGSVIIGIAVADPAGCVASPLTGLKKGKQEPTFAALARIVRERQVGGLIVGLPKNMDGTEGPAAQSVRTFVANLLRHGGEAFADMPVVFWDERFSTAAVTRMMLEDDTSRKKRAEKVDRAAAAYILQGALDALQHLKSGKSA